jgi:peptidoglycan/xylan/chitin deacetylase (PgdA/CDA1 family)
MSILHRPSQYLPESQLEMSLSTLGMTTTQNAVHSSAILDHYRCPEMIPDFKVAGEVKDARGFFRFGPNIICYGRCTSGKLSLEVNGKLFDASQHVQSNHTIALPFDVNEVVDNLRFERYAGFSGWQAWVQQSWVRDAYYLMRPMLPVSVRKHLQRVYLRDWHAIQFPTWPLDRSVDLLLERLVILAMKASQTERLPFIWFWPNGHRACAILTHDVETTVGRDFCGRLMDIDDAFGIKASFQVVPEKRYAVPEDYLQTIRERGFEINVQGLNHDGDLFRCREGFLKKAQLINEYAGGFGALGFRSPVLYRNTDWFQDLSFSYDMSVPNVARLEAQRGGCCTLMPYFLPGGMTELPLTTAEDYTLFHVLNDYSTTIWKQQLNTILESHGLMTLLIHPDYVAASRAQDVFKELLEEVVRLRSDKGVWVTLPREVDRWWRERSEMNLVADGNGWKIEGSGSDRARIAYACLDGDRLVYEV